MVRFAVIVGLMLVVLVANGCPRKVVTLDRGDIAPAARTPRGSANDREANVGSESEAPGDSEAAGELPTEVGLTDDGTAGEEVTADSMVDDVIDAIMDIDVEIEAGKSDNDAFGETSEDNPPLDDESANEAVSDETDVVYEDTSVDEPIVDEVVEEDVIEEEPFVAPSFTPEPPKVKLSREAVRFAGSWQAVVFDFGGESEHATGERFVVLNDTGTFDSTALNRDGRLESGIWSKDEGTVSLSFGPAGDVKYDVDHAADNISIWHGPSGGAMFCIRLPDAATAMSPGERYESNFGPVEFSRSGPGYWKGTYGDPEGTLVLQNAGEFLYGTWEQGELAGYAIFEFNQRGFEGYWWYSGQTSFGGEWRGEL